ncbi:hypothetical protein NDU88_004751 [Pleurodeles waltl]|uniref:[histone H3]-lysine(4) N-trimethyltransferase n=1 Tax=Pleurodeles waltl TaxID=8319 RepID=A0AAV7QH05_PLEWA|nr:hypothetical protein NDU88_004751 [Pleurodeles waltl]
MASKVEKFKSAGKGYGLRATSTVSPGEVLYVSEPFSYTVNETGRGLVCEFCLCTPDRLLQCSQCKFAKYCSKQCQRESWRDHKRECTFLKNPQFGTGILRLVGKIVFKILRKSSCPSEELYSVSDLEANLEKMSNENRIEFERYGMLLQHFLKDEIVSQLPAHIKPSDLFAKVSYNAMQIEDGAVLSVAIGLYPSMSLVNHSCDPNCVTLFMGRHVHLRAIKNIKAGDELTIQYTETMRPTEERQRELMRIYCFECDCHRCQTRDKDDKMLAGDKQASDETKALVSKVLELQESKKWKESLALCRDQLKRNSGRVPDENIYQLQILDYAMEACMALNLLDEALQIGYRTLAPYRLYASGVSRNGALKLMHLGFILYKKNKRQEAIKTLKEAFDVLRIFFGTDHLMTKDVLGILK